MISAKSLIRNSTCALLLAGTVLVALPVASTPAQAQASVTLQLGPTAAPPPPRVERVPPPPRGPRHAVWVPGRWNWDGHNWVWVAGRYNYPPPGRAAWVPGHWDRRGGHYVWVDGHWR